MTIEVLDPSYGDGIEPFATVSRLETVTGMTIGIISNGKQGTGRFFDAFADHLRRRHGVAEVVRLTKPNYSAPAGADMIDQARRWGALVAGVGD